MFHAFRRRGTEGVPVPAHAPPAHAPPDMGVVSVSSSASGVGMPPAPPAEEVDIAFQKFVDETMGVTGDARDRMMSMDTNRKWLLLNQSKVCGCVGAVLGMPFLLACTLRGLLP
ncbi:hypothetical protein EON66_00945 [archaeon]|nr:MAG: hypothetical protein EON66_00945 [archaeon]